MSIYSDIARRLIHEIEKPLSAKEKLKAWLITLAILFVLFGIVAGIFYLGKLSAQKETAQNHTYRQEHVATR